MMQDIRNVISVMHENVIAIVVSYETMNKLVEESRSKLFADPEIAYKDITIYGKKIIVNDAINWSEVDSDFLLVVEPNGTMFEQAKVTLRGTDWSSDEASELKKLIERGE